MVLHIVMFILKILCMILLAVAVLVLLALFFPVKYMGKTELKDRTVAYRVCAGWLFRFLYVDFSGENDGGVITIRVLGIPVKRFYPFGTPESEKAKSREEKDAKKEPGTERQTKENPKSETKENPKSETKENPKSETKENPKSETKGNSKSAAKEKFSEKNGRIYRNVKSRWNDFYTSVKDKKDKASELKKVLKSKVTRRAYQFVKANVPKLLRHIRPRRFQSDVTFGAKTPDRTGQALGLIGVIFPVLKIPLDQVQITPDFERQVFEGTVTFKGYMLLGVVLYYILKLYFNRDIRRLMKKFS